MTEIYYSEAEAQVLKDKVVVLTGGAQGIGAATVTLYHALGAHVYFGDWDEVKGQQLERELSAANQGTTTAPGSGSVHFQKLDVRDYASQLALFDTPFKAHGRVDVAVSCAAVTEVGGWFEPEALDLESVKKEPLPLKANIDINLTSVLSFSRIALAYMKASNSASASASSPPTASFTRSICLVSSIAGITEAPGLFSYSASKHGVIGLMRALRPFAPLRYGGVRVNAVCPWATDTQLLRGVKAAWAREKMPLNAPLDVAKVIVQCSTVGRGGQGQSDGEKKEPLNGTAIFVSGGRYFDTEEGVERTMPLWMGEENASEFLKGQEILGLGGDWN